MCCPTVGKFSKVIGPDKNKTPAAATAAINPTERATINRFFEVNSATITTVTANINQGELGMIA